MVLRVRSWWAGSWDRCCAWRTAWKRWTRWNPAERLPVREGQDAAGGARFVEGFVTASLVFCVGPLTILGSLDDGLGRGIDKLALKATCLDRFASVAFAASLGWGVAAHLALAIAVVRGC